jgi:hypothetical protein
MRELGSAGISREVSPGIHSRGLTRFMTVCFGLNMTEDTELLREIRDLLRLMAEPALAERDKKRRALLLQIVGKSKRKAEAVVLMDGSRSQAAIRKDCAIDAGDLSRLIKALREASLIGPDDKQPKTVFPIPTNFLDAFAGENG